MYTSFVSLFWPRELTVKKTYCHKCSTGGQTLAEMVLFARKLDEFVTGHKFFIAQNYYSSMVLSHHWYFNPNTMQHLHAGFIQSHFIGNLLVTQVFRYIQSALDYCCRTLS